VPEDERLARAVGKCEPVVSSFPNSVSAKAIMRIAEKLHATAPPAVDEGAIGFFRPMVANERKAVGA
jgi:MinD-like ATPase involved in chromosome partitioning or flagellar assembly